MTRVLGIDPGTHRVGWGVIEGTSNHPKLVAADCLEFPQSTQRNEYLIEISEFIEELISAYHPDKAGIEALFVRKNLKTAISVAEARGVILHTFAAHNLPWTEISPSSVKSTVGGSGSAGKLEVARMVGLLLHIDTKKVLDDTTDALAIALAAQTGRL